MPAGCEFICNNEECKCFSTGFVVHGAWPLGKIQDIIISDNVKKNPDLVENLKELQDDDREYSCINCPNIEGITIYGYRIESWCHKCLCIHSNDLMLSETCTTIEEVFEQNEIPTKCPKCEEDVFQFEALLDENINCPYCKQEMKQHRWFSNE